ncbi:MAG TPA: phage portal protein [Clostridiales bacterium]|nr:phage portal protein [Clostridiales bacterium]
MSSLNAFLHPIQVENQEVIVSNRFLEGGKPVPFIIRPISEKENGQLIKKYTRKDRSGRDILDRTEYAHALVASAVVFPELSNAELQKKYNVLGETALLTEMLNVGEYALLSQKVSELSGLNQDINKDIDEVKN